MPKWKYHHDPIILLESSDHVVKQLLDDGYTEKLASDLTEDIALYINRHSGKHWPF
ncbi:hypothetical protein [Photobacterium aquae]|uniref:hypothetical protein n=1 Tax=Photobacterium aquae TaxID=1195763 RepID=UPI000AF0DA30|nr:hypothetical protein [Photobacterium aquae]